MLQAIAFSHGSRYSVFVELNKPAQDYTLRVAGDGLNQKVFSSATFRYSGGTNTNTPNPSINYAGAPTSADVTFLDSTSVVPFPPVHPSLTSDQTYKLLLNRTGGTAWTWALNDNNPFNESLEDNTGLSVTTKNGTWVDLILVATITAGLQPPHPIHKHSNKAHIIVSLLDILF
jgi:hypothetical protein